MKSHQYELKRNRKNCCRLGIHTPDLQNRNVFRVLGFVLSTQMKLVRHAKSPISKVLEYLEEPSKHNSALKLADARGTSRQLVAFTYL